MGYGSEYEPESWHITERVRFAPGEALRRRWVVELTAADHDLRDTVEGEPELHPDTTGQAVLHRIAFDDGGQARPLGEPVHLMIDSIDVFQGLMLYCDAITSLVIWSDQEDTPSRVREALFQAIVRDVRVPQFGSAPQGWETLSEFASHYPPAALAVVTNFATDGSPVTLVMYYVGFTLCLRIIDPMATVVGDSLVECLRQAFEKRGKKP